jgi:hypothetical protein
MNAVTTIVTLDIDAEDQKQRMLPGADAPQIASSSKDPRWCAVASEITDPFRYPEGGY